MHLKLGNLTSQEQAIFEIFVTIRKFLSGLLFSGKLGRPEVYTGFENINRKQTNWRKNLNPYVHIQNENS